MINEVMKMNKRLKPLIIGFAAMMISGCSNPNAGNKPVSETVSMTALEISPTEIDIPQGVSADVVMKVVITDEVKVITFEGIEYRIPVNKVSEDDGMNYNRAFSELSKAKAENRVLPGFPDTELDYVFEGTLPATITVYGGCAMKPSGEVIFPAPKYLQYSGAATENMKIKTGSDPAHLSSDSDALSQERYQVIKIVYEKDEQMYECFLFGKKGTANK